MSGTESQDAGGALAAAIVAAVSAIPGLNGCGEGRPTVAAPPYATIEIGAERDWGHKTGAGREIVFRLVLRDEGESPARLRALMARADAALAAAAGGLSGWALVSLVMLRGTTAGARPRLWACTRDYRARMLAR